MKSTIKILTISVIVFAFTSNTFSQVPNYVPTSGLVGYWPFNGNANDESGNGNNGSVIGGAILGNDRYGSNNSSYEIDGLNCPNPRGLSIPVVTSNVGDYSISIWYKSTNPLKQYQCIINSNPHQFIGANFNYLSSSSIAVFAGNGTWWSSLTDSITIVNASNWNHLAIVKNGLNFQYFNNGILMQTMSFTNTFNTGNISSFVVGAISINGGSNCYETFHGSLDDLGIWNRALTQQEITDLFTSTVPPTAAVLSGDATICAGASTNLSVAVTGGTAPYTVTVTDGTNNYSATGASPVSIPVSPTATSSYTIVSVTGGGTGTGNTGTAIVTVIDATITASDSVICAGETVSLSIPQGGSSNTACAALPTNLQTGLVGYWPFCGNANDASGNGNNGTANGATLTADRFGNVNSAYSFNGSTNTINCSGQSIPQNNSFAISLWVYPNDNGGIQEFLHQNHWPAAFYIGINNGYLRCGDYWQNTGVAIVSSVWQHIVIVRNYLSQVKIYLNGNLVATLNSDITLGGSPSNPLVFGKQYGGNTEYYYGVLDDLSVYNRTLSASEIQQLYTLGQTTYLWSNGATTPTINVSPTSTTTYTCTVTTNGVSCTDSVTVVVNNPTIDLGNDVTVCGTSTTLTAPTGFDSYLWSNGATTNTTTVSANGTYSCTVTQGGCSATDSIDVTFIDATISASDSTICAGETVTLSIPQGGTSNTACAALPTNLQSGLVGYWPFCGNANDASGNGNNGTVNGATLTTDRFGSANSAYSFDGLDDLISCSPGLPIGSSPRTLVSWFKTNAGSIQTSQYPDFQQIAGWGNPYGGPVIFNQWVKAPSGHSYFESGSGGNQVYSINAVNDNQWHQFVTTYGGPDSKVKIYIDGVAQDSSSNITLITASSYLGIGNCPFANTPFQGLIDDVSVWDRALSLTEIQALYSQVQLTYSWSPGGFTTSTINVTPTQTTTYACTTTTNGVSCTDSVTVVVNNPTIDLGNDVTVCGTSTTLTAPTGFDSYLWSNGSATNTTTVTSNGTYSCTVTQGGCSASDSIEVVLVPLTINTTNISAAAAYTWENNGQTYTSSGIYTGTTVNCETQVLNLTITPLSASLSLQVFLDGYYTNSSSPAAMTAARYNNLVASGSTTPGAATDVDVITVELRSPYNLDVVAYSVSPILQTNGSAQCVFPAGALGGSYYIVVKHRATNPLWSANPITLTTSTTYNFANNLGSAYSDGDLSLAPMHTIVSSLYGIWLGELNEDGYLDATDYSNLELDIYASGYLGLYLLDGDLNGDTYVDASDFAVFESNSIYGLYEQRPYAITTNVSIGQSYQGGIVAYILQPGDPGYDANEQHGLIAAPSDQGTAQWGCTWTTAVSGAYGQAIGTGAQNTIDIMNGCSEAGIAARLCGDLVLGGYSDWYLPSLDELNKLYLNKVAIGGFAAGDFPISIYWSSTAFNNGNNDAAWGLFFYDGIQNPKAKVDYLSVRAVRAF